MNAPAVTPAGRGEVVGDAPDRRVEILCEHDALHATWSRFGPHREGAELHVHHEHVDCFFVLEGDLALGLGTEGGSAVLPAGTIAWVPPLVVHGFSNESDGETRFLNLHAPGCGFGDFLRGLRDGRDVPWDQHAPPAAGVRPVTDAVVGHTLAALVHREARIALLVDVEEIAVAEVSGTAVAERPHVHRRHAESAYVLEGELSVRSEAGEERAGPGTWVQIPAGAGHAYASSGRAVRYLELHTPGARFGAFVRARAELGDGERATEASGFDRAPV
jgi:quercetin dioxygenase-like cupin family protein